MGINKDEESIVIGEADKEGIHNIIKCLLDSISKEKEENIKGKYQELIEDILDLNAGIDLKNIEKYDIFVNNKIDDILKIVVNSLNPEVLDGDRLEKLYLLYKNYGYLENNIEKLIAAKESYSCVADKSRWLLDRYKDYIVNDSIPDMDIDEKCYWKPKFGSGITWMEFCDGLMNLYYGYPEKYLLILKKLLRGNEDEE